MEAIKIICIILITLGVLPLIFVFIKRKRHKSFMKKAITTTAEVTHCQKRYGSKGSVYYILSLQYKTIDDKHLLAVHTVSSKREKGDQIPLMYLPGNPEKISIDSGRKIPLAIALTFLYIVLIVWFCVWLYHLK